MRTANRQQQNDRRTTILGAAEQCFARSRFHQTSMNDICQAAGMSPGNLYRYFPSKEAIILGIAERHRAEAAADLDAVEKAPSFYEGLAALARHYMVERSAEELDLGVEIVAECRRNPAIAAMFHDLADDIRGRISALLRTAVGRGEISADTDCEGAAMLLMVLADGISLRRVADRNFDAERMLPQVFQLVEKLLGKPVVESARAGDRRVEELAR